MRADLEIIQQWVKPGHHVLDLGCGDGTLLDFLKRERNASGFGLEINPDHITTCMDEMLRLGDEGIVTFPNFAHWRLRWGLALSGRMPESEALPYKWYNTPNIRLCTFKDFEALCRQKGIRIKSRRVVDGQHQNNWLARLWPNLLGEIAIYRITREKQQ